MKCLHTKYQNLYQKMLHSLYPHSINETEEGDAMLEIIYPRSEGSRKLMPTNVNETFPLCLIHPIPLYVPRLFHHRCFLIFSRPATLELASGRGSTTSCHFIILAHSSLRLGHERGDYLGLRDVSTLYGALHDSLFRDQQITVNFISRAFPSFLFKIFRPDN